VEEAGEEKGRREKEVILEEFMKGAVPSDRLIVEDSTGELYKGFVACLGYTQIDRSRKVKKHGLSTEIFRKELKTVGAAKYMTKEKKVPVESISEFSFSDLAMMIYTKVVLEG